MMGHVDLQDKAELALKDLLTFMLAPSKSGRIEIVKLPTHEYSVEFPIRWTIDGGLMVRLMEQPARILREAEGFLKGISERITYGEVAELRDKVAAQAKELAALQEEVTMLRRYRDAFEVMHGRKLQ